MDAWGAGRIRFYRIGLLGPAPFFFHHRPPIAPAFGSGFLLPKGLIMPDFQSRFALGDIVREKLSAIGGRVVAITFWETNCTHVGVKQHGVNKEGRPHEICWFDEPMLDFVASGSPIEEIATAQKPGGPLTTGQSYPER